MFFFGGGEGVLQKTNSFWEMVETTDLMPDRSGFVLQSEGTRSRMGTSSTTGHCSFPGHPLHYKVHCCCVCTQTSC